MLELTPKTFRKGFIAFNYHKHTKVKKIALFICIFYRNKITKLTLIINQKCCYKPLVYNGVSSVYCTELKNSQHRFMSFMYIKKSRGPKFEPWGTPIVTLPESDISLLMQTDWVLKEREDLNQILILPGDLYDPVYRADD